MADTRAAQLRRLRLNVHLWIALSLVVLLVPISISGGLLVWHDEIDSVLNPKRYAVSGSRVSLQPLEFLAKARRQPRRPGLGHCRDPDRNLSDYLCGLGHHHVAAQAFRQQGTGWQKRQTALTSRRVIVVLGLEGRKDRTFNDL